MAIAAVAVVAVGGIATAYALRSEPGDRPSLVASAPASAPPPTAAPAAETPLTPPAEEAPSTPAQSTTPPPTDPPATTPPVTTPVGRLAAVEAVAQRFVTVIEAKDCNGLWVMLSSGTQQLFERFASDDGTSGRDGFCGSLASSPAVKMTVRGPARSTGPNGAVIDLEYQGEVEPLRFLNEGGSWKIDLVSDLGFDDPEAARSAQTDLRNGLTAERVHFTDAQKYTDDVARLREIEPALVWRRGIATPDASTGEVYVSQVDAGRIICLSARSNEGTLFMLKADADGKVTYAAGEIPPTCDTRPLGASW